MPLRIIEAVSIAAGLVNEDRVGMVGDLAWVIDGATDVVDEPLVGDVSDAAWFANALDSTLRRHAEDPPSELGLLIPIVTHELAAAFNQSARRSPKGRQDHPSASALIVRERDGQLDYLSVGDCTLLAEAERGLMRLGTAAGGGDRALAATIRRFQEVQTELSAAAMRDRIWPHIRATRGLMNDPNGYGVISITEPPLSFVCSGTVQLASHGAALMGSDGLLRLVDVFTSHSEQSLVNAARSIGLCSLIDELRALEVADPHNIRYPRAKTFDDASGVLLAKS
jgi:Protein phosphatase 2C